jgi:predicted PolB exonuclease-like 3'-5' exonuclease
MCPSGATCLTLSAMVWKKAYTIIIWSSVSYSLHDIAEEMFTTEVFSFLQKYEQKMIARNGDNYIMSITILRLLYEIK